MSAYSESQTRNTWSAAAALVVSHVARGGLTGGVAGLGFDKPLSGAIAGAIVGLASATLDSVIHNANIGESFRCFRAAAIPIKENRFNITFTVGSTFAGGIIGGVVGFALHHNAAAGAKAGALFCGSIGAAFRWELNNYFMQNELHVTRLHTRPEIPDRPKSKTENVSGNSANIVEFQPRPHP
jgi:hypothetical protein